MNIPNKITLTRFGIAILLIIAFSQNILIFPTKNYILTGIFLLGTITDILDGFIARKYNQITTFGIFIDPIADKILILTSMICLVYMHRLSPITAIGLLGRDLLITGFRLIASEQGIVIPAVALGKLKTIFETILIVYLFLDFQIHIIKLTLTLLAYFFAYLSLVFVVAMNKDILKRLEYNKRLESIGYERDE